MDTEPDLQVALIEPEIPGNTGNIARTCAALGVRLHLVHPLGFSLDDKYVRRAGLDYWNLLQLVEHDTYETFERQTGELSKYYLSTRGKISYTETIYESPTLLVFGKETAGIERSVLQTNEERVVRIPMLSTARSLNLSNAVAIVTYEVMRQRSFPGLETEGQRPL